LPYYWLTATMKKEQVVLSFIAVLIGILVAGVAFYLYQSTRTISQSQIQKAKNLITPSPTQAPAVILTVSSPENEDVVDKKTIVISGKTNPDAIVVITTAVGDQVVSPASNGNFSATATIDDGANIIEVTAIAQDGQETKVTRTITYSTETF